MYKDKDNAHAYFDYDVALSKRKQTLKLSLLLITIFPKLLLRWEARKRFLLRIHIHGIIFHNCSLVPDALSVLYFSIHAIKFRVYSFSLCR